MFTLRPIPCADLCDRVACQREPETTLDASSRLAAEFRRARVRLCMACLAQAESELAARQRAERLAVAEQRTASARRYLSGGFA